MDLYTERTTSSPLSDSDSANLMEMYMEQDSFKFITPHNHKDKAYYQAFIQRNINANQLETCVWVVRLKSNEFIGTINLNYSKAAKGMQIGCHLKRAYWRKGFGIELLQELSRHALEDLDLPEIRSIYETRNQASASIMRKINFDIIETRMEDNIEVAICQLKNQY